MAPPPTSKFILCLVFLLPLSSAQTAAVNGVYWFPESGFAASDIDSTLFTHIFCAFAGLDPQTNQVFIPSDNTASFASFTNTVQAKNPSVKTLLSIGGGSANPSDFSAMAASPAARTSFINSSISAARSNGFCGLDLDWEYPQTLNDMTNLGSLLSEWRQAITAEASGKTPLILTAAFYYSSSINGLNYPTAEINSNLDWVNAMAYDFYAPNWYNFTSSHAMLYNPWNQVVSGSYGITEWIQAGVSPKKLVLGMPFYGYAWKLADADNHGLQAPATGPAGPDGGAMGYNQIRNFITQNNAPVIYNETLVTNYCYSGNTWIGYDDTQSIRAKVGYAKQTGLLGYFAWHVGDDYNWALSQQAKQTWEEVDDAEPPANPPISDVEAPQPASAPSDYAAP